VRALINRRKGDDPPEPPTDRKIKSLSASWEAGSPEAVPETKIIFDISALSIVFAANVRSKMSARGLEKILFDWTKPPTAKPYNSYLVEFLCELFDVALDTGQFDSHCIDTDSLSPDVVRQAIVRYLVATRDAYLAAPKAEKKQRDDRHRKQKERVRLAPTFLADCD
jgi:hypothetical protein